MNSADGVTPPGEVLARAALLAGVDLVDSRVIRDGSHAIYELTGGIVARIGKRGSLEATRRELLISQWLNKSGIPTVEPALALPQPIIIDERPVTWWHLIPDHRASTPAELGSVLRALHTLEPPTEPMLLEYNPFDGLRDRIAANAAVSHGDQTWLLRHHDELQQQYNTQREPSSCRVIHGDAWQGNLVVRPSGVPTLLDLDKVSLGPPEWDLVQLAVDYTDFNRISEADYRSFVTAYGGDDVTGSSGFRLLADIQELRWTAFALGQSGSSRAAAAQAKHRIACLRGSVPRPWTWDAL